jgi:uncharacterized MnhB-related membrane protein
MVFVLLLGVMIIFSILAIVSKDLLLSVIFLALVSLTLALIFFLLQAPDVAITEASVNAGLITLIYVVAIRKTERMEK